MAKGGATPPSSLSSLLSVATRTIELGRWIENSIVETSAKCVGGEEKVVLAFENKEVCVKETVFSWDLERQVGVHQVKKSRQNILGEEM